MSTPPAVGKNASVKIDPILYDDLATMMRTGMTVSDAVRTAVSIVAGAYRNAWDSGRIPNSSLPTITHFWISGYDSGPTPITPGPTPRPTVTPPGTTTPAPRPTRVRRSA